MCADQGSAFLAWAPLASGFLIGGFDLAELAPDDLRHRLPWARRDLGALRGRLAAIAARHGVPVHRVALASATRRPGTYAVVGARTPAEATDLNPLPDLARPTSPTSSAESRHPPLGPASGPGVAATRGPGIRPGNFRIVQLTPPGSGCSIQFGIGLTSMAPGSLQGILLVVDDIEAATVDLALSIIAAGGAYFTGLPLWRGAGRRTRRVRPSCRCRRPLTAATGWRLEQVIPCTPKVDDPSLRVVREDGWAHAARTGWSTSLPRPG